MTTTITPTDQPWSTLTGEPPIVIAHRGLPSQFPDHTLAGYAKAAELGADFIEPDLVSTKDGVLIARHEPNLIDTTDIGQRPEFASYKCILDVDGKPVEGWFAKDLTLAQIKTLRAIQPRADRNSQYDGQFEIPTLEEILQLREQLSRELQREIGVYIETKHPTWHQMHGVPLEVKLLSQLSQFQLTRFDDPVYIQSFELSNLEALSKISDIKRIFLIDGTAVLKDGTVTSGQPYDFAIRNDARTYLAMLEDENLQQVARIAHGIGPWKMYIASYTTDEHGKTSRLAASDLVQRAHAHGLLVHPFTFRNEAMHLTDCDAGDPLNEYRIFLQTGIDGLFSDYTDTAVEARQRCAPNK